MAASSVLSTPLARKALVVGVTLVVANLVLAGLGPRLPEPVIYPTREIQLAVERLEDQVGAGCVDVLVTGNSVAAEALSAQRLAEGLGLDRGAVSVLPGSIGTVDVDWMNRVTLPRSRPAVVVYVASPLMFVPEELASLYGLDIYERSVALRAGWFGTLHRWGIDHVPLVDYRLALADFEGLVDDVQGTLPDSYADVIEDAGWTLEPDGHIRSSGSWSGSSAFLDRLEIETTRIGGRWRIDEEQREALLTQFQSLQPEHRVVLVIPPVVDELVGAYPGGVAGFSAYLDAARSLEAEGVTLVDLSGVGYPNELFRDTHHLNGEGADQFTAEVTEALAGTDWPRCRDAAASPDTAGGG